MNQITKASRVRAAYPAALIVILGWAWISPPPALAQGGLVVTITSPASGSTVAGTITVKASVSAVGVLVAGVQFKLDGANLGGEDTTAPYSVPWDTTTASNGSHTLMAVAQDALGVGYTSDPVSVTVSNAPPPDTTPPTVAITSPVAGSTVSGTITITASASDNVEVAWVRFYVDGLGLAAEDTTVPYSTRWDTTTVPNGSHTLTAVARDAAGNAAGSSPVTVTVSNGSASDTTPPTVAITSPAAGSTVSGATTITASASDNVGVVGVQFFVDGAPRGSEDTTAPYSTPWDTTTVPNGSHTLTAVARDAAGNATTSAPVTVTVSNASPPPPGTGFQPGDIFLSLEVGLEIGDVQWRAADGTLKQILTSRYGPAFWMAFDAAGNLYVPHWNSSTRSGNTVERFDSGGRLLGTFGETCAASPLTPYAPSCYYLDPSSIDFDRAGNAYVGQSHGTQDILKFDAAGNLLARFDVAVENVGSDFITLAPDGCTIFYTSRGANVLRYDVCSRRQLPAFNASLLPGYSAYTLRFLSDGGLLVANHSVISRLDATGTLLQTYDAPVEDVWTALDLVGDGTFWASSWDTGNVYRFDLATGAVLARFNAAPAFSVIGLTIR